MSYFNKKRFTMRQVVGLLTVVFLGIAVIAYAAVTIPNSFSSGTTISSGQVNANFTAVANQMPGVKTTEGTSFMSVTSTAAAIQTINVTTPGAGYLIITGSGSMFATVTAVSQQVFRMKVSNILNDVGDGAGVQLMLWQSGIGYQIYPFGVSRVFTVPAAGTYTYYLNMHHEQGSANTSGAGTHFPILTAVFIPNALP